MQVWNVLQTARWKYRTHKKSPKICHLGTVAQLCRAVSLQLMHVSTVGKKLVKQQYLIHVSSQYGEPRPTNRWNRFRSLGHPSKFPRFRVLPSLLQRRRWPEASQTLHDVWLSPGLVHCIYIFGGSSPLDGILPGAKFTLRPSRVFSCIGSITARHLSSGRWAKLCGIVQGMELRNFYRGCHLYLAGRPSRWSSAHILVWKSCVSHILFLHCLYSYWTVKPCLQ